jgi:hypothetical protein
MRYNWISNNTNNLVIPNDYELKIKIDDFIRYCHSELIIYTDDDKEK